MPLDTRTENSGRTAGGAAIEQRDLIRLLCRAATRLAVAAQGIDPKLDDMLVDLRQLLRRELGERGRLEALIDAIDARIKHVDDERDQRGAVLQRELHRLAGQLLDLNPAREISANLKAFQKQLKARLADGSDFAWLAELSSLQQQALASDSAPKPGLLTRWLGRGAQEPAVTETVQPDAAESPVTESSSPVEPAVAERPEEGAAVAEPPFSRISAAVSQVLHELLCHIEPPPEAIDKYRHARAQIENGLNWYELVSTLEEVSLVVLAALEQGQGEIQRFLASLNQRLLDAGQTLQASRRHEVERRESDAALNQTVRLEVAEMRAQVAEATELEQLKAEVEVRLESVVGAMDRHKEAEQVRQRALEEQLDMLTARMQDMEAQAAVIEGRLVEQRRLALLDTLTQLPNRQAYDERLQQEYQRWLRYGRPLALAICDIDYFKQINDSYGHLAGDKVLRVVAKALRSRLRQADFIARFGGEEFVILMPETSEAEAFQAIEAIRLAVAQCPFHFREKPVTITVSAGLAVFEPDAQPDAVFERADAALYRAKQAGRNCCVLAST